MDRLVVWNPELVTAFGGLDVVVRCFDGNLRVHAQGDACRQPSFSRQSVQQQKLAFGFNVEEKNVCRQPLAELLTTIQQDMLAAARERLDRNTVRGGITYDRFRELMDGEGAFVFAGWCGSTECAATIKEETKATIRVLPDEEFRSAEPPTQCLRCGRPSTVEAVWARAY